MARIGLFYDSDTGNTRKIAKQIAKFFTEEEIDLKPIRKVEPEEFTQYDAFILGTPTLGEGELPENWDAFLPALGEMDLSGKTIALFGLGDQVGYADEFVDGLGLLHAALAEQGAEFIGSWPDDGYEYEISMGELDSRFYGLVLDQDNQSGQTPERLETWLAEVKPALLAIAAKAA